MKAPVEGAAVHCPPLYWHAACEWWTSLTCWLALLASPVDEEGWSGGDKPKCGGKGETVSRKKTQNLTNINPETQIQEPVATSSTPYYPLIQYCRENLHQA